MSHYVTPFLVLNLGSEMVFVVAQRLQAQSITLERANLVLDEIISVLISKHLITDLMKPQAPYGHEAVRELIEDVTQSSMMRLDATSMGKLWDLITMVFKWQLTMSPSIISLTIRHLYEIETYITNPETQLQLHKVQNLVDNFRKILSKEEQQELRDDTLYWLKESNVRVSLLLRMGLQASDGQFITNNLDPIAEEMLKNLGENIYAVTQNGKVLEHKPVSWNNKPPEPEVNELKLFVDQMLEGRKLSDNGHVLRLAIDDQNANLDTVAFDRIDVTTEEKKLGDIMDGVCDNNQEDGCLQDDLLAMISGESQ